MKSSLLKFYRVLFGRKIFFGMNRLLFRFSLTGMGILNYENYKVSGERAFLSKKLDQSPGAVVIDVGANAGDYVKSVLEINRDALVYAFEPHPGTYARLRENLAGRNARAFNLAVGDVEGKALLYDYESQDGSPHASVFKDVIEGIHKSKCISHDVDIVTLDMFCAANGISRVSLLKIDTEGNEYAVLCGARKMIANGQIDMIHFEFNEMNVSSRTFFRDFWKILGGFEFYRLLLDGMVKIESYNPLYCEVFAYQNIVAVRRGCI